MRKTISAVFSMLFVMTCLIQAGCSVEEERFPDLVFDQREDAAESSCEDPVSNTNALHELTAALPLSDETVSLLMKLYYAKNNDLFPEQMSGADISIEYLNAINTSWIVNTVTCDSYGLTAENLQMLADEGISPDIFLASDIDSLITDDMIASVDQYIYDDPVSVNSVYINAAESLRRDGDHYGLPFYTSVYLLAGNREYLPESGVPEYNISKEDLISFLGDIPSYGDDGSYITRFFNASVLEPFLGEEYVQDLTDRGLTSNSDTYGADPRLSRTCGMWLMRSGEFNTWDLYYPDGLYFTMLPTDNVNAEVFPICLSNDSDDPDFAASFASFICFDEDAQLLIRRLEPLRGFFPATSYPEVWDEMSSDGQWGVQAMLYEQYMGNAVYEVSYDR
ncbi:MAG: hypothetical protein IKN80_06175 [Clostridiales bacterium]|nr:hypothetical protein [Clostridiales bacterium]